MVQGLQSYKWVCLKCGNIIWYIPAIIGVKHQRWLKSCSLKGKILLREGTKSCYIRDGHCIKLLTFFSMHCNCWIKRIEHEYAKSEGSGHAEFKYTDQNGSGQSFGSMKVMHCCRIERSFAHPGELDIIHGVTRNNVTIRWAAFSYPLFRNVWFKMPEECQTNVSTYSESHNLHQLPHPSNKRKLFWRSH